MQWDKKLIAERINLNQIYSELCQKNGRIKFFCHGIGEIQSLQCYKVSYFSEALILKFPKQKGEDFMPFQKCLNQKGDKPKRGQIVKEV